MANILVTGATGFVGRSLVPALIAAGHKVRCAVRKKNENLMADQVLINCLEQQANWSDALHGIDTVIHLAARVHVMQEKSESALDAYCHVNTKATKCLAEQAAKHQVKRFIFLSSIKVNGEFTKTGAPFTESVAKPTEDPYGRSKYLAEQHLQLISQNTGMEYVIIRPPLIYGPGVQANFLKMMELVSKGWPLPFARVHNRRDFIFIDNLVSALCAVVQSPKAANQVYLVADDVALSLTELLKAIGHHMDVSVRLLPIPVGFMRFAFKTLGLNSLNSRLFGSLEVSTDKIKSHLGWTPQVTTLTGIGITAQWYKNESNV